jgi:hypothetical protein
MMDPPPNPLQTAESPLDRERAFHDGRASSVTPGQVVFRAFENLTAPDNRLILRQRGDLRGKTVLDLGSGLGESAIYFALRARR